VQRTIFLYRVCDAEEHRNATLVEHLPSNRAQLQLGSEPALHSKRLPDGMLSGLHGPYGDDCLMGGYEHFEVLTKATIVCSQGEERALDNSKLVSVRISPVTGKDPYFTIDQVADVYKLELLPKGAVFKIFASAQASTAWLGHTRPDLCCGINL